MSLQQTLLVLKCYNRVLKINNGEKMISVIVTFKITNGLTADILKEKFLETSTLYLDVTGLRRKNYIYDLEDNIAGGVYTFDSIEDAKEWFDEVRINWITERYSKPKIKFFATPVVVDNEKKQIVA